MAIWFVLKQADINYEESVYMSFGFAIIQNYTPPTPHAWKDIIFSTLSIVNWFQMTMLSNTDKI